MQPGEFLPIIFSILSGVAFALLGLSYKVADSYRCRPTAFATVFALVAGTVSVALAPFFHTDWGDWRLWALGCAMGAMLYLAILAAIRAYAFGPASVIWTTVNLALIIPIVFSALLLGEQFLLIDILILGFFTLMLLAFARGMQTDSTDMKATLAFFVMLLAVFGTNGLFLCGHKIKSELFQDRNTLGVSAILYLSGAALALLIDLLRQGRIALNRNEWRAGTYAGLSSAGGLIFFLFSISLPAIVTYPISQGVALLGGVLLTTVIFRERLNVYKSAGLALGMTVILVAVFRKPLATLLVTLLAMR